MSDGKLILTINFEAISKQINALLKKASSAIGVVLEPVQIILIAKAEAKANLIKTKSETEANLIKAESEAETNLINVKLGIETSDLERRAMYRWAKEEVRQQANIEKIIGKALLHLNEQSDPRKMDDDWVTNFFNKSQMVSDNEMQDLWARVLAGEANSPGSYSKRTTSFLVDLDKKEAELFQTLCGFGWSIDGLTPLIFDTEDAIYNDKGINFGSLMHLESIGLVQFDDIGFVEKEATKSFLVSYCGRSLTLTMEKEADNDLSIGQFLLTRTGRELSLMCQTPEVEVDGFFDYVKEKWSIHLPEIKNT